MVHLRRLLIVAGGATALGCAVGKDTDRGSRPTDRPGLNAANETFEFKLTDAEWRQRLGPEQYAILRQEGTERPYTSPLLAEKRAGRYACAGCGLELFSSQTKYDSRTGWPSFHTPIAGAVIEKPDTSYGMVRTAIDCRRCGSHTGHVFPDGPQPTGLRYCINGLALTFVPGPA